MRGTDFDVVQIGYGPVGQTFAALAGKSGCKIGVYERYPALYGLPRAGHIDHEIMRILQSIGCATTVERDALRSNKYEWRNNAGQVLLDFEWNADGISGWASDYLIFQPDLESALDGIVRAEKLGQHVAPNKAVCGDECCLTQFCGVPLVVGRPARYGHDQTPCCCRDAVREY